MQISLQVNKSKFIRAKFSLENFCAKLLLYRKISIFLLKIKFLFSLCVTKNLKFHSVSYTIKKHLLNLLVLRNVFFYRSVFKDYIMVWSKFRFLFFLSPKKEPSKKNPPKMELTKKNHSKNRSYAFTTFLNLFFPN